MEVGDLVIANKKANQHYSVTREGWVGKVDRVFGNGTIDVISEDGKVGPFQVSSSCFELVSTSRPLTETSLNEFLNLIG